MVLVGTKLSQSALCKFQTCFRLACFTLTIARRTYGTDIGEDIREGFEPGQETAVVSPSDENNQFQVGDDDDNDSEESKQWKQSSEPALMLKPKYGLDGEAFENVWGSGDSSTPAPENP